MSLGNPSACLSCTSCMGDLPNLIKTGKTWYSAETYVGNWYEETCRNTIKRDEFLRKRECGDLKIQRTQTMIDLLLKPTELTQHNDGYLHYGDIVQIVSPGPTCATAVAEHPFKRGHCRLAHLALSACVPPSSIDHAPYLNTDSIISASPLLFPVVRNSFVIEHPRCHLEVGQVVNYGDVFRIRALPTQHFKLYLFSAPPIRLHHAATHSAKPKVRFSDINTTETLWSAWPMDDFEQLKMELGLPIPMKKRLYIKHNGTGINLSTEPDFPVLTYFGNELEVTVDTKKDRVRRPTYPNWWYFDTDRGRPRPDECLKQFMEQSSIDASHNAQNIDKSAAEEEKCKEKIRKEREEEENEGNEDECDDPTYMIQQQIRNMPIDDMQFRESLRQRDQSKDPTAGGQLPYDYRTGPQPNAYAYKVFKNDPYFPNTKWNCGDTDCCNVRPPPQLYQEEVKQKEGKCECECIEPEDPPPNINARINTLKPLLR